MSKTRLFVTLISAAIGLAIGILVADWKFKDPDVLLSSRILFGLGGAIICGYIGKWAVARRSRVAPQ